jgi:chaperonin GroES
MRILVDRILVKVRPSGRISAGGILIPLNVKDKMQIADVLVVGPGRLSDADVLIPMELKPGDVIMYRPDSITGRKFKVSEYGEVLIIRELEVWAKIEETK